MVFVYVFSLCSLSFFKAAYALYDSEFYVKADDDIYLRPGNLIAFLCSLVFAICVLSKVLDLVRGCYFLHRSFVFTVG
jgi:hypothetical protein